MIPANKLGSSIAESDGVRRALAQSRLLLHVDGRRLIRSVLTFACQQAIQFGNVAMVQSELNHGVILVCV